MNKTWLALILVFCIKASLTQFSQKCSTSRMRGECIAYDICPFIKKLGTIVYQDDITQLRDRASACRRYGNKLMCCEEGAVDNGSGSGTKPPTIQPTTIMQSTRNPTTNIGATNGNRNQAQRDPLKHPNYRHFKNLKCGIISSNRVANGNDSNLFEFPWAARLGYDNQGFNIEYKCGGTVISDFYVLTAAHCLRFSKPNIKLSTVRLGDWDTSTERDCDYTYPSNPICADPVQDIAVASYTPHPNYDRTNIHNDIGIVRLQEAANFNQRNIRPICLPFTRELQELPGRFVVIGWGRTEDSFNSNILQKASLPLYERDKCLRKFSTLPLKKRIIFIDGQFCAGGEGRVDACRGDSGSSLQAIGTVNNRPRMVQYGIVSYGTTKCGIEVGFPGVYTKTSEYLNFLLDNMQ
ncbi:CLUMA_CG002345, isoform A [Clunio marinus]|uniref:CLUMA_CG002345, isoform A n=1 Tax=Clunio marinus TaxID=568069 RepID=A0A1J1HL01_9DIPT|nr:CLUMA_CG002345, isoform A [Clunio marinus]